MYLDWVDFNNLDLIIVGAFASQTIAPEESLSAFWDVLHSGLLASAYAEHGSIWD